nr:hypothetical protein CTI12_AA161980 [Tanacetum cinerariifolium]
KGEKQQPSYLLELVKGSKRFEGVKKFDNTLLAKKYPNCWSLPVVTLTSITLSLPNIQHRTLKTLLHGVSEGLGYAKHVERTLNNKDELVSVHKVAKRLWRQVECESKWLGNKLQDPDFKVKTALQIVEWFKEKSRNMVNGQQPYYLLELVKGSKRFEGVKKFDNTLLAKKYPNCWSLPVVTLTSIALSLPNIQHRTLKTLLHGVSEGLVYAKHVERTLNNKDELVTVHKVAKRLWRQVECESKWLGNKLQDPDFKVKTALQIVEWFKEKSRNMVNGVGSMDVGGPNDDPIFRSICANSMYRITETILILYKNSTDEVSKEELFKELSSMISDILAACLTNIPQVIIMKCKENTIEKREESVRDAATLLGKTTQIINTLHAHELPNLNLGELPFLDKWLDQVNL